MVRLKGKGVKSEILEIWGFRRGSDRVRGSYGRICSERFGGSSLDCQRQHHPKVKNWKNDERMDGWQLHVKARYPKLLHYIEMGQRYVRAG